MAPPGWFRSTSAAVTSRRAAHESVTVPSKKGGVSGFGRAPYHKAVIFYKNVRGVRPRVRRTTRGNRGTALQQRSQVCLQIAERPNRHTVCHALRASHALFYLSDAPSGARREPELAPPSRRRQHCEGQRRWRPGLYAEWHEQVSNGGKCLRQRHMLPLASSSGVRGQRPAPKPRVPGGGRCSRRWRTHPHP